MVKKALLVKLDAKHGMDAAVQEFLRSALPLVREETGTSAWFALRFGKGEYGIFDAFPDDAARDAHMNGAVAAALRAKASELFDAAPEIIRIDVISDKLPASPSAKPITKGLLLTFKSKSGNEAEVEEFLRNARSFVMEEEKTVAWFAIRLDGAVYGIFDVFPDNGGRFAHMAGHVPRELAKHALTILGGVPDMELCEVLADAIRPRP